MLEKSGRLKCMNTSTQFSPGHVPHNKGAKHADILKKVELFRQGKPIFCKLHGLHGNWRLHSRNNVQCRMCSAESQRRSCRKYPLRHMIRWAQHRDCVCEITEEFLQELLALQAGRCALSGVLFDEENRYSLDRIDSSKG